MGAEITFSRRFSAVKIKIKIPDREVSRASKGAPMRNPEPEFQFTGTKLKKHSRYRPKQSHSDIFYFRF